MGEPNPFVYASFFFNDTATTEIYTLSLHDALPICRPSGAERTRHPIGARLRRNGHADRKSTRLKLQSHLNLVCRLLLEKKKKKLTKTTYNKKNQKKQQTINDRTLT